MHRSESRIHPLLRIPPPLLFVATFLLGIGMQHVVPIPDVASHMVVIVNYLGKGVAGLGAMLAICCVLMFLYRRTTLVPVGNARRLLVMGPYRVSRNPVYLSLVLVYLGVAISLRQVWPLLLLPLPVLILQRIVIPFEEGRMHCAFGGAYQEYCNKVRRWL